jgi:hypothetical protein
MQLHHGVDLRHLGRPHHLLTQAYPRRDRPFKSPARRDLRQSPPFALSLSKGRLSEVEAFATLGPNGKEAAELFMGEDA